VNEVIDQRRIPLRKVVMKANTLMRMILLLTMMVDLSQRKERKRSQYFLMRML